ncbi:MULTISPECIES: SpaH/EbpB family LPXTG-anchored major pilin [Brevibacterium]|uniref:Outer membrane protein n=3 Tax=Brevibacterium casei TaxID=33889 RepID=K9AHT6_9MICO|nr:SpaH/EbpB family LPXTG-anchored major pilin [Brevibacterium casei]NJE66546.1 isopeptide-forming domain-containing fimbrial protein [Brevibacterium sp. LS14]SII76250.1 Fimbrial subunit type 1 precursor [Mycobacteroides abscessus subsp. abscessus]EKU45676.1 outer membrane protein [Brevibacterium casei S18]MCT1767137.1 SpaH/EbpB family LPXTG-anchored major pilin [Brevibacterium casei]MCT2184684.1 SpaH/EbpB family LPXTG-anchored major pilin [Brevibacterium casei]
MKATLFTRMRWIPVLAAAAALSLVGVSLDAPTAEAAGNINPDTPSSLTINKYDGDQGPRGDGTEIEDTSSLGTPLAGVEFTIRQVLTANGEEVNLDTAAGWDAIDGVVVADVLAGDGFTFGDPITVTTDANGQVTQSLPHGLYIVEETDPGPNNIVSPAQPFLVTLPLPQTGGQWLYDVNVYPKNKTNQTTPTKEVSGPTAPVLGNDVTWTITAPIPGKAGDDTYRSFTITDTLDPRLTCKSITVEGFTAGTDYTATCSGQTANIEFTSTGLGKLEGGQNVVMNVVTTVTSLGDNGVIENKAIVSTNGSEVTTNPAKTNWGPLEILKYADDDTSATLGGARFEIYESRDAAEPIGELTTGEDGTASISLWVGSNDVTSRDYYLKEVAAPAGYTLPADPWTTVTVQANGESNPTVVQISNQQKERGELPFTGANGQLMLTILGIALLLLAIGAAVVRYTRARKA